MLPHIVSFRNSYISLIALAALVFDSTASQTIVSNSNFESGTSFWTFYTNSRGSFRTDTVAPNNNRFGTVIIDQSGSNVQLYQPGIKLQANKPYRLTFNGYSNTGHDVAIFIHKHTSPYNSYGLSDAIVDLPQGWSTHSINFISSGFSGTTNDGRLRFWFASTGAAGDRFYFDDITIELLGDTPPSISQHPSNAIVSEGGTATFQVTASGSSPLSFRWQKNGVDIQGATTTSYVTPSAAIADSGSLFRCIVSNSLGSVTSTAAQLIVTGNPPTILTQPLAQSIREGDTATFSVVANGTMPLTYQWLKNATIVPTATNSIFTIAAANRSDSGSTIACRVTNSYGSNTSSTALLHVSASLPTIIQQPASVTVQEGQTARFSIAASGSLPLYFQWQRNETSIAGATTTSHTTPPAIASDNGSRFRCIAFNTMGADTSVTVTLSVNGLPPSIVSQPANDTVQLGERGVFSIIATGSAPLSYQWQMNGTDIPSATDTVYTTLPATLFDNGKVFRCFVRNSAGVDSSRSARLVVSGTPPRFAIQPINQTLPDGQRATFVVQATGSAPLTFQWQRNESNIPGASDTSYVTPPVSIADTSTRFRCLVFNEFGSDTSRSALLSVLGTAPTILSQPVSLTIIEGQQAAFTLTAAGSAPLTYQWLKNGSEIQGATSSTHSIATTLRADSGAVFRCVISNASGRITSEQAILHVVPQNIVTSRVVFAVNAAGGAYTSPMDSTSYNADQLFTGGNTHYAGPIAISGTTDDVLYQTERWGTFSYNIPLTAGKYSVILKFAEIYWSASGKRVFNVKIENNSVLTNFDIFQRVGRNTAFDTTFTFTLSDSVLNIAFSSVVDNAKVSAIVVRSIPESLPPTILTHPAATVAAEGDTARWSIFATGSELLLYQWQRNGVSISGATNASYVLPNVQLADNGAVFRCIVNNPFGGATSNPAMLTVGNFPPTIITNPVSQTVADGQPASFACTAGGSPPLQYQWLKNSVEIFDARSSQYTIAAVVFSDSGATFACIVRNQFGVDTTVNALLHVRATIPAILAHPSNRTVNAGDAASFSITASGTAILRYQWQKNGRDISAATNSTYLSQPTTLSDNGALFRCVVSNSGGSVTSNAALLTVVNPPLPGSRVVFATNPGGGSFISTVDSVVYSPDSLFVGGSTWSGSPVSISGTEDDILFYSERWGNFGYSIPVIAGNYAVTLRFAEIYWSSRGQRVFNVSAEGNLMLSNFDILAKVGRNTSYDTTLNITVSDGALNLSFGSVVDHSKISAIVVRSVPTSLPPFIHTNPLDQEVFEHSNVTFSVGASGTSPLQYQWQKNNVNIVGATNAAYTTPPVTSADNGAQFRCVVANSAGSATSTSALLTVQNSQPSQPEWVHLSSSNGNIPVPNSGTQQTASLILDIDKDGINDFVIAERTAAPSLVWYRRVSTGWTKYPIDTTRLSIEAGGAFHDIDRDGDLDIAFGGDYQSSSIWWWENPYPNFNPNIGWKRRIIKNSGGSQHHDELFGDFNGDGVTELVFWNQSVGKLYMATCPTNPLNDQPWSTSTIFSYGGTQHEGLASSDIDSDGIQDIVGGGIWFKYNGNGSFTPNVIDNEMVLTRTSVGQLIPGGRPEVVFQAGDWDGPLRWYEWNGTAWIAHQLLATVVHGHSLQIADLNSDGMPDIFSAEMRLDGTNVNAKTRVFYNNGQGNFTLAEIATGICNHESRVADLDGDGKLDILGKPYNWNTPRLDLWMNRSSTILSLDNWQRHVIDASKPWRSIFITAADVDADNKTDIVTGGWWYKNPGSAAGTWVRTTVGAPMNQMATIYDFDRDGKPDILGTQAMGSGTNTSFAWGRNNGNGTFTTLTNVQGSSVGTFLQGIAVAPFRSNGPIEVALAWHHGDGGTQMLTVPSNATSDTWTLRQASTISQGQGLDAKDIDRDGDIDLVLGTMWLRNDATTWTPFTLNPSSGMPDRNKLVDMNLDGKLDVVIGYEVINAPGKLAWYEQPSSPLATWAEHIISTSVVGPMSLDVSDLDNDGDFDIVVGEHNYANEAAARLIIFENADTLGGSWLQHVVSTGDEHHDGAQLADIDNDGDLDIMSIGWQHSRVLLYENRARQTTALAKVASIANTPDSVTQQSRPVPTEFALDQNYPNPFNPSTRIVFRLPQATRTSLKLFDILGREVKTLIDEIRNAGEHSIVFDAKKHASGVYLCRMEAGSYVKTIRLLLLR